jgi:heme exporter protein B
MNSGTSSPTGGFAALLLREIRLSTRRGGEALTLVLFFVMVAALFPFAVGPDREVLARLAPGIVWTSALLAMLLGLDRMFRDDAADGTLALLAHALLPMEAIVAAKVIAHWLLTGLPLLVASPILAVLLGLDVEGWGRAALSLLAGTPALTALGALGAAATAGLRRGGLIAPVLILPLAVPVLIFGVAASTTASLAPLLFLSAISLVACALSPFLAALALRLGED